MSVTVYDKLAFIEMDSVFDLVMNTLDRVRLPAQYWISDFTLVVRVVTFGLSPTETGVVLLTGFQTTMPPHSCSSSVKVKIHTNSTKARA